MEDVGIDKRKFVSFLLDGVLVMIGKWSGVGMRLWVDNKVLINVYCICYCLVLVCGDVNDRIVYIKEVEKIFI